MGGRFTTKRAEGTYQRGENVCHERRTGVTVAGFLPRGRLIVPYQTGIAMSPTKGAARFLSVKSGVTARYVSYQAGRPISYHYLTPGRGSVFFVIDESHSRAKNELSGFSETGRAD